MFGLYIILIIAGFFLLIGILAFNSLINRKNKVEYAYSSTDVMLKKRRDLIPNLVESVKQYMNYEQNLLTEVTKLRTNLMNENINDNERFQMENQVSGILGKLRVAVENYPELKASQNFLQLQGSLNEIEEQISAARRAYNAAIFDYNNAVEMFPTNIFAGAFGYKRRPSFELPPEERENANVKSLFNA